jgi:hypothetical protein
MRAARLAILTLGVALCAPRAGAAQTAAQTANKQMLSLDAVRIEGKLYSPQALFIASRAPETFGRDAVVPHYLALAPALRTLPYELRPELLRPAPGPAAKPRPTGR